MANGYVNPFPFGNYTLGRIDQGVDIEAGDQNVGKPIVAIGNAKIVAVTSDPGGFGKYIAYKLLSGPLRGQVVYVGHSQPALKVGDVVRAGATVAFVRGYDASPGHIEIGWANPANPGETLAHSQGEALGSDHANTTAGANFAHFLINRATGKETAPPSSLTTMPDNAPVQEGATIPDAGTLIGQDLGAAAGSDLAPDPNELVNSLDSTPLGGGQGSLPMETWRLLSQLPGASPATQQIAGIFNAAG